MSRISALFCVAMLLPFLALAEPATVKRFEAKVHADPDPTSEVIHTLIEDQEVSVSETAESGFRRVRLPDGGTGWVEEAALAFSAEDDAVAPAEPTEQTAAYPSHAPVREKASATRGGLIYVKDLRHLAELVEDDEVVSPLARSLADRHTIGNVTFWGSFALGAGAMLAGLLLPGDDCSFIGGKEFCSMGPRNWGLVIGGGAVAAVGSLASYIIWPKRNDLLDVINSWNTRHPDEPFELDGSLGGMQ